MLVLTRKQNEKICIGDSITITVLRMKGKGVRLGIEAPRDINVIRGELCFELSEEDAGESADENGAKAAQSSQRRSKPLARPDRDTTDHWPRQEECTLARTPRGTMGGTSPLKAMVDARTV
jgi:carbon storage regulator